MSYAFASTIEKKICTLIGHFKVSRFSVKITAISILQPIKFNNAESKLWQAGIFSSLIFHILPSQMGMCSPYLFICSGFLYDGTSLLIQALSLHVSYLLQHTLHEPQTARSSYQRDEHFLWGTSDDDLC